MSKVIRGVHAFNEMSILDREGRMGFHLVDFGPWKVVVEPSQEGWEHLRLVFASPTALLALQEAGWTVVGTWFAFTYLKRPTGSPVERA
ncbi:MAG TPA: hypothetical protein VLB67_11515 [Acidimicrobiia bacterium]|nr:hypothetical protein [Acidimicrobiia bacterium]